MNQEQEIRELINQAGEAFSNLDFDAWLACFHDTRLLILGDNLVASSSKEEVRQLAMPVFESMKKRGFSGSQLDTCNIEQLSDITALVSTVWTRFGEGDSVLERIGATYLVQKSEGQWLIAMLTGHGPDVVAINS